MKNRFLFRLAVSSSTGLPATSAVYANDATTALGAQSGTPALIMIAASGILLLALVLRPITAVLGRCVTRKNLERRLHRCLAATGLEVLHNFILPGRCGGLTRVDHAILAAGGVVSVQVKHYSGTVAGSPEDPQWTCTEGTEVHRFMNPVIQNERRAGAIRRAIPGLPVVSLIVFTGRVRFAESRPENVIELGQLATFLERLEFEPCAIEDWEATWLSLRAAALTDAKSRKDMDAQLSFG